VDLYSAIITRSLLRCSLFDVLAGHVKRSSVKETILIDSQKASKNFKFMTGYVLQVTKQKFI